MSVENRIRTCLLLEKMSKNQGYSEKLGLSDESTFHGDKSNNKISTKRYH